MVRRRAKRTVKQARRSPEPNLDGDDTKEGQIEEKQAALVNEEVERQSAAVRAIRDVEIGNMLTALRLLRSYFSEEQLQMPALQFFKESLPNLSVVRNAENGQFEVQWNSEESYINHEDGRDIHASILRRLSMAYPYYSGIPSLGDFELSNVKTTCLGADNLRIKDFIVEGQSDYQMLGMTDSLRTPGVSSQRLSIGMTPKTIRLPKPGEMLLSVHGSPLGVYKEDNMEAIRESEEG